GRASPSHCEVGGGGAVIGVQVCRRVLLASDGDAELDVVRRPGRGVEEDLARVVVEVEAPVGRLEVGGGDTPRVTDLVGGGGGLDAQDVVPAEAHCWPPFPPERLPGSS